MLARNLLVKELLTFDKCIEYKILSGQLDYELHFSDLILYCPIGSVIEDLVADLGIVEKQKPFASEEKILVSIELCSQSTVNVDKLSAYKKIVSALIILNTSGRNISKDLLEKAKGSGLLIILLDDVSSVELKDYVDILSLLKEKKQLLSFLETSSKHLTNLVNREGILYVWNLIQDNLEGKMKIFNHHLEAVFLDEAMQDDYVNRQEEWVDFKKIFADKINVKEKNIKSKQDYLTEGSYALLEIRSDQVLGYLGFKAETDIIHDLDLINIKCLVPLLVTELLHKRKIIETKRKYKKNFLYDLLHNNIREAADIIVAQGQIFDWDLSRPLQLLILGQSEKNRVQISHKDKEHIRLVVASILAKYYKRSIIEDLYGQLVILYAVNQDEDPKRQKYEAKEIANEIIETLNDDIMQGAALIGIGRFYISIDQLCRSYQEAKIALDLSKYIMGARVTHFEDLGVMRLLTSIRMEQLDDFLYENLGELIKYDKVNDGDFIKLLQVYFAEKGNLKLISDKLFIHTNTLRYRLKKIEEVLDMDLQDPDDFANLYVAILIYNMNSSD